MKINLNSEMKTNKHVKERIIKYRSRYLQNTNEMYVQEQLNYSKMSSGAQK